MNTLFAPVSTEPACSSGRITRVLLPAQIPGALAGLTRFLESREQGCDEGHADAKQTVCLLIWPSRPLVEACRVYVRSVTFKEKGL
ncbi:MAG TPA: hypothetical protein VIS76_04615 [Pseudomonadales bacterium]